MSLLTTASLCISPNAYKEGKLYSVIPSDGAGDMTVVRATTATRVNADGLVELVPYNLITRSEEFDNVAWTKTAVSISANSTTSPNGILNADTLTADGTSGVKALLQTGTATLTNDATYTTSIYAKKNTNNFIQIVGSSAPYVTLNVFANFDLNTGTVGTVGSLVTATITDVSNGWYRCSMTAAAAATSSINTFIVQLVSSATAVRGESNSLSTSIFIWGAQLNEGTIKPYQKTETRLNIPRLDYSNGTCPSLLVEPQRTNLAVNSAAWGQTGWIVEQASVTPNSAISPSGIQDADLLTGTANFSRLRQAPTLADNTIHTISAFLKKGTAFVAEIAIVNKANVTYFATFNLENGTTSGIGVIEDYGNDWYRCSLTFNTGSGATALNIRFVNNAYLTTGGWTNGLTIFAWGAQLELGSYPTSYIPTTTASVTRNADVISKTGISSLIGQTEGVIYLENSFLSNDLTAKYFTLSDGTNTKRIIFNAETTSNQIRMVVVNSTVQAEIFYTLADITEFNKIAIKYKENDFAFWVNGVLIGTDTSGTVPSGLNTIKFSNADNSIPFFGKVKTLLLFKEALTNTQLAELTTI